MPGSKATRCYFCLGRVGSVPGQCGVRAEAGAGVGVGGGGRWVEKSPGRCTRGRTCLCPAHPPEVALVCHPTWLCAHSRQPSLRVS